MESWRSRTAATLLSTVFAGFIGWALSLTQGTHGHRWPWVLIAAVIGTVIALVVWEQVAHKRPEAARGQARMAEQSLAKVVTAPPTDGAAPELRALEHVPAIIERWRHTSNGFEAPSVMNLASTVMPGYRGREPSALVRVGVAVGCDAVEPGASSSDLGKKFLTFLRSEPVARLVSLTCRPHPAASWSRLAGNGPYLLEAVLADDEEGSPLGSALLLPPTTGQHLFGRADNVAYFALNLEPAVFDGRPEAATLRTWYERACRAISLAQAFGLFLSGDLGLRTRAKPAAQVGLLIQAGQSIAELVDAGELRPLPGASFSSQFLGYAVADADGEPPAETARNLLRQLCDHSLHLGEFDAVLAAVDADGSSMPAVVGEDGRASLVAEQEAQRRRLTKVWELIDRMFPLLDEERPLFPKESNWDRARRRLRLELEGLADIHLPKCRRLVDYVGRRIDEKDLLVEAREEVSVALKAVGAAKQRSEIMSRTPHGVVTETHKVAHTTKRVADAAASGPVTTQALITGDGAQTDRELAWSPLLTRSVTASTINTSGMPGSPPGYSEVITLSNLGKGPALNCYYVFRRKTDNYWCWLRHPGVPAEETIPDLHASPGSGDVPWELFVPSPLDLDQTSRLEGALFCEDVFGNRIRFPVERRGRDVSCSDEENPPAWATSALVWS